MVTNAKIPALCPAPSKAEFSWARIDVSGFIGVIAPKAPRPIEGSPASPPRKLKKPSATLTRLMELLTAPASVIAPKRKRYTAVVAQGPVIRRRNTVVVMKTTAGMAM